MQCHSLSEFILLLQTAIGPVLLISGVSLLVLAMINRFNYITDRIRKLVEQRDRRGSPADAAKSAQLGILWVRAQWVRRAIVLAASSVLFAALLVAALFLFTLFGVELVWLPATLFVLAMVALILSLLCFISEINRSLHALRLELDPGE